MGRLILVDKPEGPTSHDIIDTLRRTLGIRKIGHCGTLDPMATGLLLILTGRATRLAEIFGDHDKVYRGVVRFGTSTVSDDRQGKVLERLEDFQLIQGDLESAVAEVAARDWQVPPRVSAIKVGGVPHYKLMRQGRADEVDLPRRSVQIHSLQLLNMTENEAEIEVHCGSGTYIRSIARDLGQILGIPSHLTALRRLGSGKFTLEGAISPDRLLWEDSSDPMGMPISEALDWLPAAVVTEEYRSRIPFGSQPEAADMQLDSPLPPVGRWVRLLSGDGVLLALGRVEEKPDPVIRLRRQLTD
jgi:tRNA pseudouridine55 synthase